MFKKRIRASQIMNLFLYKTFFVFSCSTISVSLILWSQLWSLNPYVCWLLLSHASYFCQEANGVSKLFLNILELIPRWNYHFEVNEVAKTICIRCKTDMAYSGETSYGIIINANSLRVYKASHFSFLLSLMWKRESLSLWTFLGNHSLHSRSLHLRISLRPAWSM